MKLERRKLNSKPKYRLKIFLYENLTSLKLIILRKNPYQKHRLTQRGWTAPIEFVLGVVSKILDVLRISALQNPVNATKFRNPNCRKVEKYF